MTRGCLEFHDEFGVHSVGTYSEHEYSAKVYVHDLEFYSRLVFGGSVGVAEDGSFVASALLGTGVFRLRFVRAPVDEQRFSAACTK